MCLGALPACVYVCVPYVCLVLVEARRGYQIPLELKLQTFVSYRMGSGNQM